jgi:hypothetical protein
MQSMQTFLLFNFLAIFYAIHTWSTEIQNTSFEFLCKNYCERESSQFETEKENSEQKPIKGCQESPSNRTQDTSSPNYTTKKSENEQKETFQTEDETSQKKEKSEKNKDQKNSKKKDKDSDKNKEDETPWFTGTLLAFNNENIEPGKLLFQPYFYVSRRYGTYDANSRLFGGLNNHAYTGYVTLETGITKKIDLQVDFFASYIHSQDQDVFHVGDISLYFGFQILNDKKGSWIPDCRVLIGETFPTGAYQNLTPELGALEATGTGSFQTSVILVLQKLFYRFPKHPFNWSFYLAYAHSSPVPLRGFNAYGGDSFTRGTLGDSENFQANLGFEYKIDKNWGIGTDLNIIYQNSFSFRQDAFDFFQGSASSYLFSVAPEIEYNFSEDFGASIGVWYTVAGRNNFAFFTGLFTFYVEF